MERPYTVLEYFHNDYPDYRVTNGMFKFQCASKADAEYLRNILNTMTLEQHLQAHGSEVNAA